MTSSEAEIETYEVIIRLAQTYGSMGANDGR